MSVRVNKSIIEKLLNIGATPEASIKKGIAREIFGGGFQNVLDDNVLVYFENLKDIVVNDGDHEYSAEIQRRDGKNMYFSSVDGWVAVLDEDISLYKINFDWLIRQIMNALDIADRYEPKIILEDSIWVLGQRRVERQNVHIIIARNIRQNTVFDSLNQYLNNYHKARDPALVLSLDRQTPEHLHLLGQNVLVRLEEAMLIEGDNFELNTRLLAGKMGGSISKPGFSNGYRTLNSNGKIYKFTRMQSEALEFMDNENKPIHQTEILSLTSSQEGTKLRALFKGKGGKVHEAWGEIIKNDGNGNYWLEY